MHKASFICLILCLIIASASAKSSGANVVDNIAAQSNLKTFTIAVEKSGLNTTLKGKGPFTIFAPNDEAFSKIPKAELEAMMANETELKDFVAYHVVPGKISSMDLAGRSKLKTLQGESVTVKFANGGLMINNATLVRANIDCANGVIHVIDSVMMPK